MKIVVFLKPVPDNTKLKFDANGPIRDGVELMINPFDEYALETAMRLKEQAGGESTVTVLTQGEANAREVIKKSIAAGADAGFLLSDDVFKGGDSSANALVLAQAVKTFVPDFSLLIFGQQALDTADGQTGPKVAELLDLPSLTFCKNAELKGDLLQVLRETERGTERHEMILPGVLCTMKCDYELRSSNIKGVMKANKTEIPVKAAVDVTLQPAQVGAAGAATQIQKMWKRPDKTAGQKIDGSDANAAVAQLVGYLKDNKIV